MFLREGWEDILRFHFQHNIIKTLEESGGISVRKGQGNQSKLTLL